MSAVIESKTDAPFGIAPTVAAKLRKLFDNTPTVRQVWVYGSRGRGDHRPQSDIDLMVDAPEMSTEAFSTLWNNVEDLGLIYRVDLEWWQRAGDAAFRERVERDGRVFWEHLTPEAEPM